MALLILALPLSAEAQTQDRTVEDMLPGCEAAAEGTPSLEQVGHDAMFCLGFAAGMGQIMDANCQVAKETGTASPTGIAPLAVEGLPNNAAAVQAFVKWARAHPEFGRAAFGTGVLLALMAAFPCATS